MCTLGINVFSSLFITSFDIIMLFTVYWIHWKHYLGEKQYVLWPPCKNPISMNFHACTDPLLAYCTHSDDLREAVKAVPLDRILLETDGPYHFPGSNPKAMNHPGTVPAIASTIAKIKELPIDVVYHQIRQNTTDIYGI